MKKIIKAASIIGSLVLSIGLIGCSDDNNKADSSQTPSASPETEMVEELPDSVMEALFLEVLRDLSDEWDTIPDDDVVELGHLVCAGWDDGLSFEETLDRFLTVGYDLEAASVFMGASSGAFCPEHEDIFDSEI